jgi:putative tricarboxylic transport membrane protein
VLGGLLETNFRRAMLQSGGDAMIFLERPISLALLLVAGGLVLLMLVPTFRARRQEAFRE